MGKLYKQYRHLALENTKSAPSAEQLVSIEKLLGAQLPNSFREFLHVANGGHLEYVIDIELSDGTMEQLSFGSIYSADDGQFCDGTFIGEIRFCREYQKIPEGVLPFARDGGGSMFYLDLTIEGKGQVIAFVHGLPAWTGRRAESQFVEIASSFDNFVDQLKIDRETVVDTLTNDASTVEHVRATEEWLDIGMPSWRNDDEISSAVRQAVQRIEGKSECP